MIQKYPIERSTLTQQIVKLIKSRILNGELVTGDRVWAADLSDELEVSIVPVKEALLILMGEGLITNIPRRGSVIRQFTLKEMHELVDMRRVLEIEALRIIDNEGLLTDEFVNALSKLNEKIGKLRKNAEFTDRHAAYEHDWNFHNTLIQQSGHGLLAELYSRLNTQAQIIRFASWDIGPRGDKTYLEHRSIIQALKKRNIKAAEKAITAHLGSILTDFNNKFGKEIDLNAYIDGRDKKVPAGRRSSKKSLSN